MDKKNKDLDYEFYFLIVNSNLELNADKTAEFYSARNQKTDSFGYVLIPSSANDDIWVTSVVTNAVSMYIKKIFLNQYGLWYAQICSIVNDEPLIEKYVDIAWTQHK